MAHEVYAILDWNCIYDLWTYAEKNRDPENSKVPYHLYFLFDEKVVRIKQEGEIDFQTINMRTKDDSLKGRIGDARNHSTASNFQMSIANNSPMSDRWDLELEFAALKDDMTRLYDYNTQLVNENESLRKLLQKTLDSFSIILEGRDDDKDGTTHKLTKEAKDT